MSGILDFEKITMEYSCWADLSFGTVVIIERTEGGVSISQPHTHTQSNPQNSKIYGTEKLYRRIGELLAECKALDWDGYDYIMDETYWPPLDGTRYEIKIFLSSGRTISLMVMSDGYPESFYKFVSGIDAALKEAPEEMLADPDSRLSRAISRSFAPERKYYPKLRSFLNGRR